MLVRGQYLWTLYNSSNFEVPMDVFQFQKYGDTGVYEVSVP